MCDALSVVCLSGLGSGRSSDLHVLYVSGVPFMWCVWFGCICLYSGSFSIQNLLIRKGGCVRYCKFGYRRDSCI